MLLVNFGCNHHEKIIEDAKYVFENEDFTNSSDEANKALRILFNEIIKNINSIVPLIEEDKEDKKQSTNYKRQRNCRRFSLSTNDSLVNTKSELVKNFIFEIIAKVDTNTMNHIMICNSRKANKPKIKISSKYMSKKGRYSYHNITHEIANYSNSHYPPNGNRNIESIEEELVKLKILSDDIIYKIVVSPDIGFLD